MIVQSYQLPWSKNYPLKFLQKKPSSKNASSQDEHVHLLLRKNVKKRLPVDVDLSN